MTESDPGSHIVFWLNNDIIQVKNSESSVVSRVVYNRSLIEVRTWQQYRWLTFSDPAIQGAMHLQLPHLLVMPYMQSMMACLLFTDSIKRICIMGMGCGAIARFMRYFFPAVHIDAIDNNEAVLGLCRQYFGITDSIGTIYYDNACSPALTLRDYDLIFLDLYANGQLPECVFLEQFYKNCFLGLSSNGIAVMNVIVDKVPQLEQILVLFRRVFNRLTLCIDVVSQKNIIILAFKSFEDEISIINLRGRAEHCQRIWSLRFDFIMDAIERSNSIKKGVIKMR